MTSPIRYALMAVQAAESAISTNATRYLRQCTKPCSVTKRLIKAEGRYLSSSAGFDAMSFIHPLSGCNVAHDPEKWAPVFRHDHAQTKIRAGAVVSLPVGK